MIRLAIVLLLILIVLFVLWKRSSNNKFLKNKQNIYKSLIIIIILLGLAFFLATSGKFILPKIFQIIKFALPFLSKFIAF